MVGRTWRRRRAGRLSAGMDPSQPEHAQGSKTARDGRRGLQIAEDRADRLPTRTGTGHRALQRAQQRDEHQNPGRRDRQAQVQQGGRRWGVSGAGTARRGCAGPPFESGYGNRRVRGLVLRVTGHVVHEYQPQ